MIALLGYYGFGNLGDELLLTACVESFLRAGLTRDDIIVLSNNPENTRESFGVRTINRWSLIELIRVFRACHALILGGGGLFQDVTSVKSCVYYWAVVRLASLFGLKIIALGQSIGPLKSGISRRLASSALSCCEKVQVRDESSLSLAKTLGCDKIMLGPDIVMTLEGKLDIIPRENVLINLRPCPELAKFVEILIERVDDSFIGAALSDEDEAALRLLPLKRIIRVKSFADAHELWNSARFAVGMRLHFGVLSRIFGTPLALMPYDPKVSEFARQSRVPLISDAWVEPVRPLEVPENLQGELDALIRESVIKFSHYGKAQN